jgi:hypothetical protein
MREQIQKEVERDYQALMRKVGVPTTKDEK